jgi:hypothetical protein
VDLKRYVTIGEMIQRRPELNTNAPHTRGKHRTLRNSNKKRHRPWAAQELAKTDRSD